MAREITLFSGYDQKENRTTNYAILLLKMLYEENPGFLDEALSEVSGGATRGRVGVQFQQQQRRAASIPDAVVFQEPFTLFVETKNFDWFYDDQLERHLVALDEEHGLKVLLALSNFENTEGRFARIERLCQEEYKDRIAFAAVSFESFVRALRRPGLPKTLLDAVGEFEEYLDEQDLLPRWRTRFDVCSCSKSIEREQVALGVYVCPATGGHYSHQRARFFGAYANKGVRHVAEIRAVIDVGAEVGADADIVPSVYYKNTDEPVADLIAEAKEKAAAARPNRDWAARVFLLGPLVATNFGKDSGGGMVGSKQYFDVGSLHAEDAEDLARKLDGLTYTELQQAP